MAFINEQVYKKDLPQYRALQYQVLEKDYLNVLYLSRLVFIVIVIGIFCLSVVFLPFEIPSNYIWLSAIIIGLLLLVFLLITKSVFKVKAYGIRNKDIIYKTGLIFRSTTVVPFNRVQHVEIKSGPVDRIFGLSRLKVYTAGGSQSDLVIPGLKSETAQQLKELIITKTSGDEEE